MKTIIIGVGNPILTDDSVGLKVARSICSKMNDQLTIEVSELNAGGLRLMEAMVGYERAIIIDAISTDNGKPGEVYSLSPSDLPTSRYVSCPHDTDLSAALKMGEMLGLHMPSDIKIWAIEVKDTNTVSEDLTENVAKAVPLVVDKIIADLN